MSRGIEYRITGCRDCPLYRDECEGDGPNCRHPQADKDLIIEVKPTETGLISHWSGLLIPDNYYPVTPDWCPLKKESIMITILQKDESGQYNIFKEPKDIYFDIS